MVDYVHDGQEANYGSKIQIFNRFLVENVKLEGNMPQNPLLLPTRIFKYNDRIPPPITQLLSIDSKSITICTHCKGGRQKPDMSHIVDLIYPRKVSVRVFLIDHCLTVSGCIE